MCEVTPAAFQFAVSRIGNDRRPVKSAALTVSIVDAYLSLCHSEAPAAIASSELNDGTKKYSPAVTWINWVVIGN